MSEAADEQLIREVQSLRGEVSLLRDDVALMRSEVGALAAWTRDTADAGGNPRETVRKLWNEGEDSGIAGDLDEVVDGVLNRVPRRGPANP
jgi:hypothetical protein